MNQSKARVVNEMIERGEMENGHWFCAAHQRATILDLDGPDAGRCAVCGSFRVKWHPKGTLTKREEKLVHRPVNRGGDVRVEDSVTKEAADRWFNAMHQAAS